MELFPLWWVKCYLFHAARAMERTKELD